MNNFFSNSNVFGLDISNFSLKIAELRKKRGKIKLTSFGNFAIPDGVIENGEIKKEKELTEIIRKSLTKLERAGMKSRNVIVSLPEEKLFLDTIQLPLISDVELKKIIQLEIENYIPLPLEEVYFDFEKIELISNSAKYQEILITAFSKKIIDSYLKVLKNVGLQPLVLEPECFAIARALMKRDKFSKFILILDLGESRTGFTLFFGKNIKFTSTIAFSSRQLTEALAEKLKISFSEAEEIKIKQGLKGENQIKEILIPFLLNFTNEIKNLLEYYHSHSSKSQREIDNIFLDKILLCGGGANLQDLTVFLSSELKINVEKGNPWLNILKEPIKEIPELPFDKSLSYTTALGLALWSIYEH